MTQKTTVDSLLFDMRMRRPISKEINEFIKEYLNYAYAIGYEEGKQVVGGQVRIVQLYETNEIKIWPSITKAAKFYGINKSRIVDALHTKHRCIGYYWKYYIDKEDANNENNKTVGDIINE